MTACSPRNGLTSKLNARQTFQISPTRGVVDYGRITRFFTAFLVRNHQEDHLARGGG